MEDFLVVITYITCEFIRKSLNRKGIYRAGKGKAINRVGEGILRAGYGNNKMNF